MKMIKRIKKWLEMKLFDLDRISEIRTLTEEEKSKFDMLRFMLDSFKSLEKKSRAEDYKDWLIKEIMVLENKAVKSFFDIEKLNEKDRRKYCQLQDELGTVKSFIANTHPEDKEEKCIE